jgi:hypothetical protein
MAKKTIELTPMKISEADYKPLIQQVAEHTSFPLPEKIKTSGELEAVAGDAIGSKSLYLQVLAMAQKFKKPAEDFIDWIDEIFDPALDRLKTREVAADNSIKEYRRALEVARQDAERRAREENDRRNRETQAAIEAEAKRKEAQARKIKDSEQAEAKRLEAQQLRASYVPAPAPVVIVEAPKIAGYTMKKIKKYRITNEAAIPIEYCIKTPNKAVLNGLATSGAGLQMQAAGSPIPGVEFYEELSQSKSTGEVES